MMRQDECLEDLDCKGLRILQKKKGFRFGIDAVLLAHFPKLKGNESVLEAGSGTGIISLLLKARYEKLRVDALEIQEHLVDMSRRTMEINDLEQDINICQGDMMEMLSSFNRDSFDVVISNPPYFGKAQHLKSDSDEKAISRHEIKMNLKGFIEQTSLVLKEKGILYLIYRPSRLSDLMEALHEYKIEPKEIRFVYPRKGINANLVLVKAVKKGGRELHVLDPLYVYEGSSYTDEILSIYKEVNIERERS